MTPENCRKCGSGPMAPSKNLDAPLRHIGRGLCHVCYRHLHDRARRGAGDELLDFERVSRPAADVVEDFQMLSGQGYTRRQAAERMGISLAALDQALVRHRRRQRAAEPVGVTA